MKVLLVVLIISMTIRNAAGFVHLEINKEVFEMLRFAYFLSVFGLLLGLLNKLILRKPKSWNDTIKITMTVLASFGWGTIPHEYDAVSRFITDLELSSGILMGFGALVGFLVSCWICDKLDRLMLN